MGSAKEIVLQPIDHKTANDFIKKVHYSGSYVRNSQLHIGVYYKGALEGALQFGPSLDKRKMLGLVENTGWNEFLELNRLAFTDNLPRNSESRAISISIKLIKKHAPQVKWIISFADATQCGDGTIYRASGFVLTGIKENKTIWVAPDDSIHTELSLRLGEYNKSKTISRITKSKGANILTDGSSSMQKYKDAGYRPLKGYQLRYIYFIDKSYRKRLTVPEIPFSKIEEMGASMYKGVAQADEAKR